MKLDIKNCNKKKRFEDKNEKTKGLVDYYNDLPEFFIIFLNFYKLISIKKFSWNLMFGIILSDKKWILNRI